MTPFTRLPILALGLICLIGGVMAGLARLGWEVPAAAASAAGLHGALMISAFFGTVISLERAVALGRRWAYLAPLASGASGLVLLSGNPLILAQGLAIAGAFLMVAASVEVLKRQIALFTVVLAIGAACWLVGTLVWLVSGLVSTAVPWWLAFLILTVAGERLELSRFLPAVPGSQRIFVGIVIVMLTGALVGLWRTEAGVLAFSASLLALSVWLLRFDIARHNARRKGLVRFIAICLLTGYFWLLLAGILGLAGGFALGSPLRDSTLHAICLGFIFSMVFGHAPIIIPAVARVKIPYHPAFYLPLLVLHGSLLLRVIGGIGGAFSLQRQGALHNACALVLFVAAMLISAFRSPPAASRHGHRTVNAQP